jgi:hypothetical protein
LSDDCEPLTITVRWPTFRILDAQLRRTRGSAPADYHRPWLVEGYELRVNDAFAVLPFSPYSLVRLVPTDQSKRDDDLRPENKLTSERWIVTFLPPEPVEEDGINKLSLSDGAGNVPLRWQDISPYLRAFGRTDGQPLPTGQEVYVQNLFSNVT